MKERKITEMGRNVIKKLIITPLSMVCSHPFLFGVTLFVVLAYRYFPALFGFIVSSSPVIGCALLFLWVIVNTSEQPINSNIEDRHGKHDCPKEDLNRKHDFPKEDHDGVSRRKEKEEDMLGNLIVGDDEENYRDVGTSSEFEINQDLGNLIVGDNEKKNHRDIGTSFEFESNQSSENLITGDDEKKNNRALVTPLELEGNHRLENLMAKRKSRNYQRSATEKISIDFKTNDKTTVVEELSRLLVLLPPRKNHFDDPPRSIHDDASFTTHGDCSRHQGILKRNETFASGMSTSDFWHVRRNNTRTRPTFKADRSHSIRIKSQLNEKHYFMSDDDDDEHSNGYERSTKTNQREHNVNNVYNSRTQVVKKHWMSVRSRSSHAMKQIAAEDRIDIDSDSNNISTVNSVEEPLHYTNFPPPPISAIESGIFKPGFSPPS